MGRVSPLSLGLCSQVASSPGQGRSPLLPLPVGWGGEGGGAKYWASVPVFGPHPGASRPWPRPLFSAGTEEGWQGSSCTSQAGQGARGAGVGLGTGPAGETVQLGKSGGSRDGTGGRD